MQRIPMQVMSSLETLRAALGKDRTEKHALIAQHVGLIIGVALCNAPPKGIGNPADWKALPAMFADVGLKAYAEHCAAFPQYFAEFKPRSVADWETAQDMGYEAAVAAFTGCAPRTYTPEQLAERVAKREAKKAETEKQRKADDKAAREREQAVGAKNALRSLTAQQVADLIRTGHFPDVAPIADACAALKAAQVVRKAAQTAPTSETVTS